MELIGCPKTLGNNYRYTLCNSTEEWWPPVHHGWSPKTLKTPVTCFLPNLSVIIQCVQKVAVHLGYGT
jgi:hypothetical protein